MGMSFCASAVIGYRISKEDIITKEQGFDCRCKESDPKMRFCAGCGERREEVEKALPSFQILDAMWTTSGFGFYTGTELFTNCVGYGVNVSYLDKRDELTKIDIPNIVEIEARCKQLIERLGLTWDQSKFGLHCVLNVSH